MKKIFSILLTLVITNTLWAYDFQSGGLYYNITSNLSPYTVEVTYGTYHSLTTATIPKTVIYKGNTYSVTSIGEDAFYGNSILVSATIPNSVTSIGNSAFGHCSSLTSVTIPNSVTSIGSSTFSGCSSLVSITIPNSVTNIEKSAFASCSSLTSITIPNSVTSIGNSAFEYCSSLASITIPNSVMSIGSSAFYGCIFTKDSFVNNSTLNAGANNYWGAELADEEIDGLLIRNDTVIYCRPNVISVTIPNSVTSIGEYAFGGCSSLTSISIPNSVTSIGGAAFYDCSALTSIIIPNNVTSIEYYTFYGCKSLSSITIPNNMTHIGEAAFYDCSALTSIIIPNNVTSIEYYTFYGCKSLSSITLPNNITNIGEAAFHDCSSLTSIIIPNNVRNIGESVFYNCSSLKSVIIPNNVTNIGDSAFYNCSSITSCTIGNRVKSIGVKAFYNCSNLNSITFPNSVETIDNGAFEGCTSLKVIDIGRNLKSIDDFAFYYYWRNIVEEITVRATTPPNLGTTVFQTNSDIIAKVPCSKLKTYQQDSDWKNFKLEGFGGDCSCTAVPYEITCKEAAEIAYFLPSTTHTDEPYTVIGYVTDIDAYSVQSKEKQTFWMADNPNGGNVFKCYCGKAIDDSYDTRTVKIGDKVSVTGQLTRFGSDCRIEYGDVDILANGDRLQIYTVSVASNNASMGTVSGDGEYERGAIATVIATANNGYKFTKWSDGTTINPYTFTVTEDICLTATFVKDEITCEEAATIAAGLEHNTPTEKTYTVIGYVTEAYGVGSNNQQTFWMADTPNGGNVFQSYWGNVTEAVAVGDKVSLTGQIMRYNSTYEIKNGAVVILTKADDVQTYTVTASSANTSMGTVSGSGNYKEGSSATVTATPKSGYKFTKWSDGTTKNPYTFTVTKDVSLIAYFEKESSSEAYEITCEEAAEIAASLPHNTPTAETYTVIGYVTETDGVISREQQRFWMADTPNGGNVFQSYWGNVTEAVSVGDKVSLTGQIMRYNSTYQIKNGDVVILAYGYSPEIYTVSISSANTSMGTVSGGGEYEEGTTATVTATPKSGYKFTKWSDGTTKNPYTFTVTKNVTLTAYFEKESSSSTNEITCEEAAAIAASLPNNTPTTETYTVIGYVTETDGVISREQQRFWMADIQGGGNVFQSYWGNVTEAVSVGDKVSLTGQIMRYNSTYQIKNGDVVILSYGYSPEIYTVTVSSANTSMGTISGGGEYEEGTTATVTATPKSGYKFTKWSDGTTKNPYTFTVNKDISLTAYFEKESSEAYEITCEEAAEIAASLPHNTPTTETYTVIGYVTETDGVISRNQQRFWMADYPDDENVFQCYWGNVTEVMNVGDKVAITGQIMRYNSTYQIKNGDVVRLSSEEVISCEEAVEFVNTYLQNNEPSASIYNVVGYVTETDGVISRGQQRFWMDDIQGGSKVFQCYWGNVSETIKVGDYVSVRGHLMRYNSTAQIKNGDVTVLSYGTGVDDVVIHKTFDKIIHNGQLLILRDGKTYNAMGQEM